MATFIYSYFCILQEGCSAHCGWTSSVTGRGVDRYVVGSPALRPTDEKGACVILSCTLTLCTLTNCTLTTGTLTLHCLSVCLFVCLSVCLSDFLSVFFLSFSGTTSHPPSPASCGCIGHGQTGHGRPCIEPDG